MRIETHPVSPEELMAFVDGEPAAERAGALQAHVEECRECQAWIAEFRDGSALLQAWTVDSREFAAPVLIPKERRRAISQVLWGFAVTAVPCAILMVILSWPRANRMVDYAHGMAELAQRERALGDRSSFDVMAVPSAPMAVKQITTPMVAHSARLDLVAKDVNATEAAMREILKRHGGYISQMNVAASAGPGKSLDATLRFPDAELEAALGEIRRLGRVQSENRIGEDVTRESIDLDARLANARNTERRLTDLLKQRTGRMADVLEVETKIDATRGEIERMEAERKSMSTRVAMAIVVVRVEQEYKAVLGGSSPSRINRIRNAAVDGVKCVAETLFSLLTFALSSGPSLLLWGGLLFLIVRPLWKHFGGPGLSYWKDDGRAGIPDTRR